MRLHMKRLCAAMLLLSGAAGAQAQIYKVTLSGANEIPAVASNGSGSAIVSLNTTTHELRVKANFTGLTGNTTASHIHCCAVQPANAGVATTTPTFVGFPLGVTAGSWDNTYNLTAAGSWNAAYITANGGTPATAETAFATGVAAGQSYLNIHSSFAAGGEIRGSLVPFSFVPAAPARSAGVATSLNALGAGTTALNDRLVNLAILAPAAQKSELELLLPASSFAVQTVTSNTLFTEFDQLGSRMEGLRRTDGTPPDSGAWVKATSFDSDQDADAGFAGFDDNAWDLTMGYDRKLAGDLSVGISVGMAEHSLGFNDQLAGSSTDIESLQGTVYANKTFGGGVFVDGMFSFGQHDIDYKRVAGAGSVAAGSTDGEQLGARLAAGVILAHSSGLSFTPQIKLDWFSLDQDAYQEYGGSGLALNVGSQDLDRLRSSIGGQLEMNTSTGAVPFVRAFWNYDWKDDPVVQSAAFAAGGAAFTDVGPDVQQDSYSFGVGVNFKGRSNFNAAIGYDFLSGDSFESSMFNAKLLWLF